MTTDTPSPAMEPLSEPTNKYYEQGWNDRCRNKPINADGCTADYWDGFMDCVYAREEDRREI